AGISPRTKRLHGRGGPRDRPTNPLEKRDRALLAPFLTESRRGRRRPPIRGAPEARQRVLRSQVMARVSLAALAALLILAIPRPVITEEGRAQSPTRAEQDFIDRHWRRPLAPQGEAPDRYSPIERSLLPASCGVCHPSQYADWSTSVH